VDGKLLEKFRCFLWIDISVCRLMGPYPIGQEYLVEFPRNLYLARPPLFALYVNEFPSLVSSPL